jgi:predicted ATPase/DNA-binding CsgD family transcriptional regulator
MIVQQAQTYNLPPQPTPFIGRDPEISEIVGLLRDEHCRLLTLLGPGGIGKTRLSIESISRLTENDFEHGVFYVPLAPLTSADNIVTTVIGVLGIMIGEDGTPQEELVKFLSGRNLLLVMDNFEHVLGGADLVADILNLAPNVKVLVTSREALNLRVERVWHVQGMRYPESNQFHDIDRYSALKLFIDRATWVRRDFSVDTELDCAIQICQLVGGMPLAIELSASWLKTLSCMDIIKQIERGIDFLSTRARDIPDRHRSIRAVFDYSWDLLSPDEQAVFPRLSVFRGGFTLEAGENVASADLMTLSGLVEKSMVRRDNTGRYDVHELLRQYAVEKLKAVGEVEDTQYIHTSYFADFMREHAIDIKGRRQLEGLNEIEADFDNVVEAWNQAIINKNYESLERMMESLALYCDMRALYQAGNDLFAYAVDTLRGDDNIEDKPVWRNLLMRQAQVWILPAIPRESIQKQAEESLSLARKNDEQLLIAHCLWTIGEFYRELIGNHSNLGRDLDDDFIKAIEFYEEGLTIYQSLNETYYVGRVFRGMVFCYWHMDDSYNKRRRELNQRHRQLTSEISDRTGMAHAIFYELRDERNARKFDTYKKILIEAEAIWREMGDRKSVALMLMNRADDAISIDGDFEQGRKLAEENWQMASTINFPLLRSETLLTLAHLHILDEDYTGAQNLLDDALSIWNYQLFSFPSLIALGLGDIPTTKTLVFEGIKYERKHGDTGIISILYHLQTISRILVLEGNYSRAVELLSLSFNHPRSINGRAENWQVIIQLRADLEAELGEEAYQEAWERGKSLDLDTTVDEIIEYLSDIVKIEPSIPKPQPLIEPLTPRELEVLCLVVEGLTNPQIGDRLYISTGTVRVHVRNIREKLNAKSKVDAAVKARDLGLCPEL